MCSCDWCSPNNETLLSSLKDQRRLQSLHDWRMSSYHEHLNFSSFLQMTPDKRQSYLHLPCSRWSQQWGLDPFLIKDDEENIKSITYFQPSPVSFILYFCTCKRHTLPCSKEKTKKKNRSTAQEIVCWLFKSYRIIILNALLNKSARSFYWIHKSTNELQTKPLLVVWDSINQFHWYADRIFLQTFDHMHIAGPTSINYCHWLFDYICVCFTFPS